MDFKKHIPEIEKKISYTFKDKTLLTQSFTRTSFCNERRGEGYLSNEVLEFFGDSVLSTAIISILLEKKTERYEHGIRTPLGEGDFSNIRSKLADKRNLAKSTAALGLQKFLIMGEGDAKLGIENEPSVMEDLFESIVGAVYIDCGRNMEVVIRVVSAMLDTSVYLSENTAPLQSAKNALQEFCADKAHRMPNPIYKTASESGPDHRKVFERAVYIGERMVASGKGKNQKGADSRAAEAALAILKSEADKANKPTLGVEVLAKLKAFAAANKQPSPEFRDLGESADSEFIIECRLMGKSAVGSGKSKQEARIASADALLNILSPKKQKEKTLPKKAHAPEKIKIAVPKTKSAPKIDEPQKPKNKTPKKKQGVSTATAAKPTSSGKGAARHKKRV